MLRAKNIFAARSKPMRYRFLLLAAVLTFFKSGAQTRSSIVLTGVVSDVTSGSPLPGASVHFSDARIGALADSSGKFTLRNVPLGHHLIEVSHTGYTTIVTHVDVNGSAEKNFSLKPSIVENKGVTVTGVSSATSTRNLPTPVTLMRKTQLLQTASTNIIDALTHQAGISQISTGPAISKPVIRGLGYNRVVVINDGVRQEGQQWGDEHGIEIDEASVTRVEILKGPSSIMYGSDALAGVIHFITNVPAPDGTVKGNVFTGYGTNNGQLGLNANIQGATNGFNWNTYASFKSAGDYQNRFDGKVLNSRFNEKNFGGYVGLNKSWGFTHLIVSSFNQNIGLVEGERDSTTGGFLVNAGLPLERLATRSELHSRRLMIPMQNVQHYKVMSDNSFRLGRSRLKVNLGFQNNLRKEFGNAEDPDENSLFFDLKTGSYNLQWRLPEIIDLETTIGVSGMYQQNKNRGVETIIPEYDLFDAGGFVFVQKVFSKASVSGGIRYDHRRIDAVELKEGADLKFASFQKSFANVSGSAGISYQPASSLTFKANIARGFRSPTLSELASNGAHEGTNRYEYGALALTSEKSLQFDLGAELDYEHISLALSAFHNRINDFIFYRRLESRFGGDSLVNLGGEELQAFEYNQTGARLTGFETSIDIHPHPLDWLHINNTFSVVRGRFFSAIDGSDNLPLMPAARYLGEVKASVKNGFGAARNFYVLLELDKTFDQNNSFSGYNTETDTKGYTLLNTGIGTDIFRRDKAAINIHVAVNNLTNVAYQNHLSRLKYASVNTTTGRQGVFNTGRNLSVKINVPFSYSIRKKTPDTEIN